MTRRTLTLCALLLPALSAAQLQLDGDGRTKLRDRYNKPQSSQKLDEAVHKFHDEDTETRLEGIRGLGELDDPKATEYLLQAVGDPDPRIRVKAIDVLGNARAKDATSLLVQMLFLRNTDVATKQHILVALGKIGDPRTTGPVLDFLARDMDAATRGNAIFALGDIGDRKALEPLDKLAAKDPDQAIRRLAGDAARKIRERPAPIVVPRALVDDRKRPEQEQGQTP